MKYLSQILEFIRLRGMTDQDTEYDQLTGFLNLFGFVTALGGLVILGIYRLSGQHPVYSEISLLVTCLYILPIFLNHFGLHRFVRVYFAAIIPFWILGSILIVGGDFGQGIGSGANIVITALLFSKTRRWRNLFIAHNILLYILPTIYIYFEGPFQNVPDAPGDEVGVFLVCLLWISVVFFIYERRNLSLLRNQEKEIKARKKDVEELVYLTTHDMKAPVRNIMGLLEVLRGHLQAGQYDEMAILLQHLEISAENLNELINDILEVSRFSVADPSTFEQVELDQELQRALFNLQAEIEGRKAQVIFDSLPTYHCNPGDFTLVFQNLIQNGLKYNESTPPRIEIRWHASDEFHTICIEDNGIGIPEEHYEEIFQLFKRVHSGNRYTGTGIGLGLCKKIVDKYNGEIFVTSEVGQYSRFCIQLPCKPQESVKQILVAPFRELLKVTE